MPVADMPIETVIDLILEAGFADDADMARLLVDLDVVRVDELVSDSSKYLVNVNGRQQVVGAASRN